MMENWGTVQGSPQVDFVPRHYSLWASFRRMEGDPDDLANAEFVVNVDGSVWVSDWDSLAKWRDYLGATAEQSGIMTLLFAARGHIREVDEAERERIAEAAAVARGQTATAISFAESRGIPR